MHFLQFLVLLVGAIVDGGSVGLGEGAAIFLLLKEYLLESQVRLAGRDAYLASEDHLATAGGLSMAVRYRGGKALCLHFFRLLVMIMLFLLILLALSLVILYDYSGDCSE